MHVISDNKIESFKLYIKNLNREKKNHHYNKI